MRTIPITTEQTRRAVALPTAPLLLALAACPNPEVEARSYFEQRIQPVLEENCITGTADGQCHVEFTDENGDPTGDAMGNLDLSSLEAIHRRPDLLSAYGTYSDPVMLIKSTKPSDITIRSADQS